MLKNQSIPIDISDLLGYTSRFPVGLHPHAQEIHAHTLASIQGLNAVVDKRAMYKHMAGPEKNMYALMSCEGELEKVKLSLEFHEVLWAYDDAIEECTSDEVLVQSSRMRQAMYGILPDGLEHSSKEQHTGFDLRIKQFYALCRRMEAADPVFWPELRSTFEEWFTTETLIKEWGTLQEYLECRAKQLGVRFVASLTRWEAGVPFTPADLARTEEYLLTLSVWVGLMNDLFSWKGERAEDPDKIMNAVHLAMKLHNLPENMAVSFVRGMMVEQEVKVFEAANRLKALSEGQDREKDEVFVRLMSYFAGGILYWTLKSPRYSYES